jgi:hypothetical protein
VSVPKFSAIQINTATRNQAEQQRHPSVVTVDLVVEPGPAAQKCHHGEQCEADVDEIVMGVEIGIDAGRQREQRPERRVSHETKIEQAPRPRNVAADRRIHEAREQGYAADAEERDFRIDPRADRGLEQFHCGADDMKDQDDLRFLKCLQAKRQHGDLNDECGKEEEIIAGKQRAARIHNDVAMSSPTIAPPNRHAQPCFRPNRTNS